MTDRNEESTQKKSRQLDFKVTEPVNGAVTIEHDPADPPPADGGWLAWRFALVAFAIDGIVWGPPLCYGIFLPFKPYSEFNPSLAALIGMETSNFRTSCLGLLYCTGVVLSPLLLRYPIFCTWCPWIGSVLCFVGLFSASYTEKAVVLILTQGVLYGTGGCTWKKKMRMIKLHKFTPNLIYLSEWWVLKRGFIGGLTFSGESLSRTTFTHPYTLFAMFNTPHNVTGSACLGLLWGPVMQWILGKHPTPITLRYYAFVWLCLMLMLLPFFNGRLPKSSRNKSESTNMEYLKLPLFWFLIVINVRDKPWFILLPSYLNAKSKSTSVLPFTSRAYWVPVIYMPSYATSMGRSGALPLEFYSAASIASQILGGMASDLMDSSWIVLISCLTSSLSVFFMWGFCQDFSMFCTFCTIYGLFAPCYTSLWHRFAMIIAPKNPRSASIINFFLASRGIVNIMTGPLCGLLLNTPFPSTRDYRGIINACGTLLLISSLGVTMRVFYRNSPEGSSEEEPIEMFNHQPLTKCNLNRPPCKIKRNAKQKRRSLRDESV
ncbi:hypothetical protein VP01_2631g3 [Puccinia sorghi]|uniref:Major facilitator superfamily (MFS) profile domain-containing protein n=1 Tax=Puccinia sorghi TaxID=27349 RepID=A0A0L6V4B9_9BASI|nr:hypothetical protein VP01_2631g3 [Puccinia sorghi]